MFAGRSKLARAPSGNAANASLVGAVVKAINRGRVSVRRVGRRCKYTTILVKKKAHRIL
jgi:hypothetical protein